MQLIIFEEGLFVLKLYLIHQFINNLKLNVWGGGYICEM